MVSKDEAAAKAAMDPSVASSDAADKQKDASGWPVPGDEGFVHPDGTPQSAAQLAGNLQAQKDREASGSVVHGAPLATPGPQAGEVTSAAVEKAAEFEDPEGSRTWVEEKLDEKAAEVAESSGSEVVDDGKGEPQK